MSINPTPFVAGATFAAADLSSRITTVENYLNGGMVSGDLEDAAAWATAKNIVRPDFIPGPLQSVRLVSGPWTWRRTGNDWLDAHMFADDVAADTWSPIHGLAASIAVHPPPGTTAVRVIVRAGFFAAERAPGAGAADGQECAKFRLAINNTAEDGTLRYLYSAGAGPNRFRWVYHNIEKSVSLTRGVNHVYIEGMVRAGAGATRIWNRIWVKARTFVVREHHR